MSEELTDAEVLLRAVYMVILQADRLTDNNYKSNAITNIKLMLDDHFKENKK